MSCCPDLKKWNVTQSGQSSSGSDAKIVTGRKLSLDVNPLGNENTGTPPPHSLNRRPTLTEMIQQHANRMGADVTKMLNWTQATCEIPDWLNASNMSDEWPKAWQSSDAKSSSGTKEPAVAMKYIFKFNPLQGYLAEAGESCGGWSDWCCVCHGAQRRIACLPGAAREKVEWFLTEDCCESQMAKNLTSLHYVPDATPSRNTTVIWSPEHGWIDVDASKGDSYEWNPDTLEQLSCPMMTERSGEETDDSANANAGLMQLMESVQSPSRLLACTVFGLIFLLSLQFWRSRLSAKVAGEVRSQGAHSADVELDPVDADRQRQLEASLLC
jgi:hypothetical protein